MPDLQTELSKVISTWEQPEAPKPTGKVLFQPTNNISRETFNYVRDNPGGTRVAAIRALVARGFRANSLSSLFVQFLKQGQMRESNGGLYTVGNEYQPLKGAAWMRKHLPSTKPTAKPDAPARVAAKRIVVKRLSVEAPEPPKAVVPPEFNAEDFVNGLTLKQAKAVYSELKKVFE